MNPKRVHWIRPCVLYAYFDRGTNDNDVITLICRNFTLLHLLSWMIYIIIHVSPCISFILNYLSSSCSSCVPMLQNMQYRHIHILYYRISIWSSHSISSSLQNPQKISCSCDIPSPFHLILYKEERFLRIPSWHDYELFPRNLSIIKFFRLKYSMKPESLVFVML